MQIKSLTNQPAATISPNTVTHCLAYIHYYTPKWLSRGCPIAPKHCRLLAARIDLPQAEMRSLRQHPILAAHLALLLTTGYIESNSNKWRLTPAAHNWLNLAADEQLPGLLAQIGCSDLEPVFSRFFAQESALLATFLQQTLQRQTELWAGSAQEPAKWSARSSDCWQLVLPCRLTPWLLFHLLQLGIWQQGHIIACSPITLAAAPARHYGFEKIRWLLETATQQALSTARKNQLHAWLRRANTYRLRGNLLSTAQPEQMTALRAQKRLRGLILEDLAPRHAFIDRTKLPQLQNWLARQGYPLSKSTNPVPTERKPSDDQDYHWLGLRLLNGLQAFVPGNVSAGAAHAQIHQLEQQMEPMRVDELENIAQQMLADLASVTQGRDAFFPAYNVVPPEWIAQIESAIAAETQLHIAYQALGQPEPRPHSVEPLWLEKQGELYYLHAYSLRAEANLVFRLDRIVTLACGH